MPPLVTSKKPILQQQVPILVSTPILPVQRIKSPQPEAPEVLADIVKGILMLMPYQYLKVII